MILLAKLLNTLEKSQIETQRLVLLGTQEYYRRIIRTQLSRHVSEVKEFEVDAAAVRESALTLRDMMQTVPMPWERPLIWVKNADLLLGAMSPPEDFPASACSIVLASDLEQIYIPSSCTPVSLIIKGAGDQLQNVIRWMLIRRGLGAETETVRQLAQEYKDNKIDLSLLDKQLDVATLSIHPRSILEIADLEVTEERWRTMDLLTAIKENKEDRILTEMQLALETFVPKGILTVLIRRILLLMQIAEANVKTSMNSDIEVSPWLWRQYSEFLKDVPLKRLAQWGILLDKGYALQSAKTRLPARLLLMNTLLEMARS